MPSVDRLIPDYLIERSLAFKSFVIVAGALLLLVSIFLRDTYPILWILPFLGGALIEWLVVATVYIEMSQIDAHDNSCKSFRDRSTRSRHPSRLVSS